jgi:hypothetical protein
VLRRVRKLELKKTSNIVLFLPNVLLAKGCALIVLANDNACGNDGKSWTEVKWCIVAFIIVVSYR